MEQERLKIRKYRQGPGETEKVQKHWTNTRKMAGTNIDIDTGETKQNRRDN